MKKISIPIEHQSIIKYYINLSEELKGEILQIISKSKIGIKNTDLINEISETLSLEKKDLENLFMILDSLLGAQEGLGVKSEDEFFNILLNAINNFEEKVEDTINVTNELIRLMNNCGSSYVITRGAESILTDSQNLFLNACLYDDLRPVYLNKEKTKLQGFILIHNLKIKYYSQNKRKELFFSLTSEDLKELKEQIELSEKRTLDIKANNLPIIDID